MVRYGTGFCNFAAINGGKITAVKGPRKALEKYSLSNFELERLAHIQDKAEVQEK